MKIYQWNFKNRLKHKEIKIKITLDCIMQQRQSILNQVQIILNAAPDAGVYADAALRSHQRSRKIVSPIQSEKKDSRRC